MARHYMEHHNSDQSTLQVCGIDHIPLSLRKGNRQRQLNQREAFWIYRLQATKYPGLNEELDLSVYLWCSVVLWWFEICILCLYFNLYGSPYWVLVCSFHEVSFCVYLIDLVRSGNDDICCLLCVLTIVTLAPQLTDGDFWLVDC